MLEDLGKDLMKVAFAGVGAVAIAAEKACEVGKILVQKGEATVEQGRALNEQLQEKARQAAKERREQRFQDDVDQLSSEERQALRARLAELDELERQAAQAAADMPDTQESNITEIHCDKKDGGE